MKNLIEEYLARNRNFASYKVLDSPNALASKYKYRINIFIKDQHEFQKIVENKINFNVMINDKFLGTYCVNDWNVYYSPAPISEIFPEFNKVKSYAGVIMLYSKKYKGNPNDTKYTLYAYSAEYGIRGNL